jgi:hypothetical protein
MAVAHVATGAGEHLITCGDRFVMPLCGQPVLRVSRGVFVFPCPDATGDVKNYVLLLRVENLGDEEAITIFEATLAATTVVRGSAAAGGGGEAAPAAAQGGKGAGDGDARRGLHEDELTAGGTDLALNPMLIKNGQLNLGNSAGDRPGLTEEVRQFAESATDRRGEEEACERQDQEERRVFRELRGRLATL